MTEFDSLLQFLPKGRNWPHTVLIESDSADALRFAREAAAVLLCGPAGSPDTARRIREGIHPDVQLLDREDRDIVVDDIRALRRDAFVMPLEGDRKVYLLLHAQNMNPAAQNAALKLLEEPPEGVYFILLCGNVLSLLQTVRSRCVVVGGSGSGEAEEPDADAEETRRLAAAFAQAAASGSELTLFEFCRENEKLKRGQLEHFFAAALELTEAALRAAVGAGRPADPAAETLARLPLDRLMRLAALLQRRRTLNEGNVGPAHLLGTIPAELYQESRGQ